MRIRKQATKMLMIPPLPSPSSVLNPPSSSEPMASKETEEKEYPMGKKNSTEPQTCGSAEAEEKSSSAVVTCKRNDGKGWRCKRATADGNSLCDHHLSLIRARKGGLSSDGNKAKRARKEQKKAKEDKTGHGPAPVIVLDSEMAITAK